MKLESLPVNWFDLLFLTLLIIGGVVGRKKGMSEEMLPLFQWLLIVVFGALYYEPAGKFLARSTQLNLLAAYLVSYLFLALLISLLFGWIKRLVGEKLVAGDLFGQLEYYLGMLAGSLRFACLVIAALALLHAPFISPQQLAEERRMQRENFGSISFPTLGLMQQAMFHDSAIGRVVTKYLNDQLIAPTSSTQQLISREGLGKRREQAVEEVLSNKK